MLILVFFQFFWLIYNTFIFDQKNQFLQVDHRDAAQKKVIFL